MSTTYVIIALLICAATLLARGSARRLIVAGAVGLLLSFVLQPFSAVYGTLSRYTVTPTPLGLSGVAPWLWLAPIVAITALVCIWRLKLPTRATAVLGLVLGGLALGIALVWTNQAQFLLQLSGLPGVLEIALPLMLLTIVGALALIYPAGRQRALTLGLGFLAAVGFGVYLFGGGAPTTFDSLRGYYKVTAAFNPANDAKLVREFNRDLPRANEERTRIFAEWQTAQSDFKKAETRLENARTAQGNLSSDATSLEFTRAQSDWLDARRKYNLLREQQARAGDTQAWTSIQNASQLPSGYVIERDLAETGLGRDSSEAGVRRVFPDQVRYGYGTWLLFSVLTLVGGLGVLVRGQDALEAGDLQSGLILAGLIAMLGFGFHAVEFNLSVLLEKAPFMGLILGRAIRPDFQGILGDVLKATTITVATAFVGTALAAFIALPLSLLAARNLTFRSLIGQILYVLTRVGFNVNRGVDTLILALVFVSAVGLGPFAGVLAMAIHSSADLGKLYSEAIENADRGPIEALEASGAPGTSVVRWSVLPQILPLLVSYTVYRFEINFRVSAILGFVGAGGIGFLIQETMRSGKYEQLGVCVLVVIVMVNVLDFISAQLRRRLIG
jgi:phosphonate transport system permease protein